MALLLPECRVTVAGQKITGCSSRLINIMSSTHSLGDIHGQEACTTRTTSLYVGVS